MNRKSAIRTTLAIVVPFVFGVVFWTCSEKDPAKKVIAVVGRDTLTAGDVEEDYRQFLSSEYGSPNHFFPKPKVDSLRKVLAQKWIDRKLILRQARADGFVYPHQILDSLRKLIGAGDRSSENEMEMLKTSLYLTEMARLKTATKWEAKEKAKKIKARDGRKVSVAVAKHHAQREKLQKWIRELRGKGGFKIVDKSLPAMPKQVGTAFLDDDTIGGVVASLLKDAFVGVDKEKAAKVAGGCRPRKTDKYDKEFAREIASLMVKPPPRRTKATPAAKKKASTAHLYRKPKTLKKTISQYLPDIKKKYKKELKRKPNLKGRVLVRITIAANGVVTHTEIAESQIRDKPFLDLLAGWTREWKFPKIPRHAGELVLNYPIDFSTEE